MTTVDNYSFSTRLKGMKEILEVGEGLVIEVGARTDRGLERPKNDDAFLVKRAGGAAVLAVCDGMGGARGGDTASRLAVETLERAAADAPPELASIEDVARRIEGALC